jgi:hypothetical protein
LIADGHAHGAVMEWLRSEGAHAEGSAQMAGRKEASSTTAKRAPAQVVTVSVRASRSALQSMASRDPRQLMQDSARQLMREAAWSRMFGRVEVKNPFR